MAGRRPVGEGMAFVVVLPSVFIGTLAGALSVYVVQRIRGKSPTRNGSGHQWRDRNVSTATKETYTGINQAMDTLIKLTSSTPWADYPVTVARSVQARIKQALYDMEQLKDGRWCLDETVNSTVNIVQNMTGITTRLTMDVRPEKWLSDLNTFHVARLMQECIFAAFLNGLISEIHIHLEIDPEGSVLIEVRDDGPGFDVEKVEQISGSPFDSMAAQARLIEGNFQVNSTHGRGTVVTVTGRIDPSPAPVHSSRHPMP